MKYQTKTSIIIEQAIERFQQGGFVNGDYVVIRKNVASLPEFKEMATQTQEYILNCLESDLKLRVSAIKSSRPAMAPVDGGMNAATDFFVDVVMEYAPGLYKNPLTLPIQFIELVATGPGGFGTEKLPDSQVYKNNVHGPKELTDQQKTPKANTRIANSNTHPDNTPGAVGGLYNKDHKAGKTIVREDMDIWEAYVNSQKS